MNKLKNIRYLKTTANPFDLGDCISEVAFVGRSNVGKSSILNSVCGTKNLAKVSQVPGKTRTINVFGAGNNRCIVDLPGYGFAVGPESERRKWKDMIEGYILSRQSLCMLFMLVDAKVGPTSLDRQMVMWLQNNSIPFCVVANKCDQVKFHDQQKRRTEIAHELGFRPEDIRWVSAAKGTGIKELEREIANLLE